MEKTVISYNNLGMFRITRQKAGQNPKVKKTEIIILETMKKGKLEKKEDRWIIYMWLYIEKK